MSIDFTKPLQMRKGGKVRRKPKKVYRLPEVEYMTTTSVQKYIDSWRKVGMPVARRFNCRLVGW